MHIDDDFQQWCMDDFETMELDPLFANLTDEEFWSYLQTWMYDEPMEAASPMPPVDEASITDPYDVFIDSPAYSDEDSDEESDADTIAEFAAIPYETPDHTDDDFD